MPNGFIPFLYVEEVINSAICLCLALAQLPPRKIALQTLTQTLTLTGGLFSSGAIV